MAAALIVLGVLYALTYAVPAIRRARETRRIARLVAGWRPSVPTGLRGDYEQRHGIGSIKSKRTPYDWEKENPDA